MTSGTGEVTVIGGHAVTGEDARLRPGRRAIRRALRRWGAGPPCGRSRGFTLVEIMVVMAIVVMLFGLVAVSLSQYLGKASKSATVALILKLEQHLDEYKSLTGHYPPDGVDSVVRTDDGVDIKGSACLYYFLSRPVVTVRKIAGRTEKREHPAIASFKATELGPEDPDVPGVRELVDGWATPIHYDNTEDGVFRPQRGEVHIMPIPDDEHPSDPRDGSVVVDGTPAVVKEGIQSKSFDIWSHGQQGHEADVKPNLPVGTWNKEE